MISITEVLIKVYCLVKALKLINDCIFMLNSQITIHASKELVDFETIK